LADLRAEIAARPWKESAALVTADILGVAKACADRQLPVIEIKQLCTAFSIATAMLLESMDRPQNVELLRLMAAMETLSQALGQRVAEESVQSQYAEVRVSSCRALCQNHDPALDQFPKLVELSRKVCSEDATSYLLDVVGLGPDQFLDMLEMLAADQADAATVANPAARIRVALTREVARHEMLHRKRWQRATPEQLERLDSLDFESTVIVDVDWEHAKRDLALPPYESRAIEARMEGVNLQAADAPDELGWDAARLSAVRRSLAGDRPWGRRLRKRLIAYGPGHNRIRRASDLVRRRRSDHS
jgi:hypothetical protein